MVGQVGRMWHHSHVVIGQKPSSQEGSNVLAHCHGGAAMCCYDTDQVASFAHSPVDVSKLRHIMQH